MLILLGIAGLLALFSFGFQGVHEFFEPPTRRPQKKRPSRVRTPWGPRPTMKAAKASAAASAEFWTQLGEAIRRDPMVLGFVPREDSAVPLNGWTQAWLPAHAITAGSPWGPSENVVPRRLPLRDPTLRDAKRNGTGKW